MNLFTKQKETHKENKFMIIKVEGKKDRLGVSDQQIHTTAYKINKDLLNSTGNYILYLIITYSGKEGEKECVCLYVCG